MQIPQIVMQSRFAQIDISTTPAKQTIQQPKAQQNLQQPKAEMTINTAPGTLTIDQTAAWESMDIKHIFRRIAEKAQKGVNDALNGTARRATEGDEMMRIEHGGSAIASQAKRNSPLLDYGYNIGFVPPPFAVKINYQPGTVRVHAEPRQVINQTVTQKPVIDYQKGQVNIRQKQHAELHIDFKR